MVSQRAFRAATVRGVHTAKMRGGVPYRETRG